MGSIEEDMDIRGGEEDQIRESAVVISIEDLPTSIGESMNNQPKQLKITAGRSKCSIFRIPRNLEEINPQAYHPRIVSIGPYHHGKLKLSMMEEHKWRYLKALLARSEQYNGRRLQDYLEAMGELEEPARACYSQEITTMKSGEFVRMLLLDGCFLVELFRIFDLEVEMETKEDPIFNIPWLISFLARDLLKLENQLPLFVLQSLYDLSYVPNPRKPKSSIPLLAIKFFSWVDPRPHEAIKWSTQKERSHLLDLLRATFISPELAERKDMNKQARLLHCVTKLVRAGIEFRSIEKANTFLDIKFKRGVLMIPQLKIDDFASSFLQNCIAFEQSHQHSGDYFTTFATFMDCLIDTEKDVSHLGDVKIIENNFGKDKEVANFFNKLGRDAVVYDIENCYLGEEFEEVNRYYASTKNVMCALFKSTYFSTPWSFMSALAASILLILTVTQTTYTIYPYYHPNN